MTFEEFKTYTEQGNVIPVYKTFLADLLTPVSAFMRLQSLSEQSFLFESVEGGEHSARFSFIGCNPFSIINFSDNKIEVLEGGESQIIHQDIFKYLDERFAGYSAVKPEGLPRFTGGAVGYFGYETIRFIEDIPIHAKSEPHIPESTIMLFDTVLAFDHLTHHIFIIKNVILDDEADLKTSYEEAIREINSIWAALAASLIHEKSNSNAGSDVESNLSQKEFCDMVVKGKEYITAGDIFQVVLSQKFQKKIGVTPFDIYRALRVVNPSPYLYFIKFGDAAIIGSSPELLVRVEDRQLEVRPIAGTRKRGSTPEEDEQLEKDLLQDKKEIAEHVMLVDLGRNDVGHVSKPGTVEVTEFMIVEKYSHVMHIVSNVKGELRDDLSALDALKACFPAGTVSGAPKIRAMEIITELEPEQRGVYAGALGYLDFSGNLDTCIAIRTIITKGDRAYFQAGAGIVADSVPEKEYQETMDKSAALRSAIAFAERGLT